jgi:hypothetical protein
MANLILKEDVQPITSVFNSITLKYQWENPSCLVFEQNGFLAIRVDVSFFADVEVGGFVQILNGSYRGTYEVTGVTSDADFVYFQTGATWNGADLNSNLFNIDEKRIFELYAGYSSGAGQAQKPYIKIADIAVAINPITALFEVDVQAYLRSYFEVNPPISGNDYGLSLQWELISVGGGVVVPTTSTIDWSKVLEFPVSAGIRITANGVEEVNDPFSASVSGSFDVASSTTIFIDTLGIEDEPNQGTVTLTVTNTTDAVVDFTEVKDKTNNNGRITFAFTVQRNKDYSIAVTTQAP